MKAKKLFQGVNDHKTPCRHANKHLQLGCKNIFGYNGLHLGNSLSVKTFPAVELLVVLIIPIS